MGISVFNDVFAFRKIFQCEFVSRQEYFGSGDSFPFHRQFFTSRECCDGHCNIVGGIDFQVLCFHHVIYDLAIYDVRLKFALFYGCDSCFFLRAWHFQSYIVNRPDRTS